MSIICVNIGKAEFQRVAREIGEIQKQCGLKEPVEDFVEQVDIEAIQMESGPVTMSHGPT